jgi:hypothetical protein
VIDGNPSDAPVPPPGAGLGAAAALRNSMTAENRRLCSKGADRRFAVFALTPSEVIPFHLSAKMLA